LGISGATVKALENEKPEFFFNYSKLRQATLSKAFVIWLNPQWEFRKWRRDIGLMKASFVSIPGAAFVIAPIVFKLLLLIARE
jgi:hypothetical protein